MGRTTTRMYVRRDLDHAQKRIVKIEDYLARCGPLYIEDHPNVYELFCASMTIARMLKESLVALRGFI